MSINLSELTIKQAHHHLKRGDFSAVELAERHLKAIEEKNPELNAYVEVFDDVLEQAEAADKRIAEGTATPLTGIPLATKDNILIKGKKASAASNILTGYIATYDATAIAKLKENGAVFMGRANMDDAAMGTSTETSAHGITKNPHDTSRVPGGSSGGPAAALAAGIALGALGSDTNGSARQPASFCGVVGLKPTYGSVSRHGLIALGSSLDVVSPMARTVTDAELLLNVIQGKDKMDSTSTDGSEYPKLSSKVKKIGVPREFLQEEGIDTRALKNFDDALAKLANLGYEIVDITLPTAKYAVPDYYVLLPAEASANLARYDGMKYGLHKDGDDLLGDYFATRGAGFGPEPKRRILIGTYVLSAGYHDAYYNKALAVRKKVSDEIVTAFNDIDVVATPTTLGPAFKIGEKIDDPVQLYLEDMFTGLANQGGFPAISIPSGTVEEGGKELPLGLHFIAPHMQERRLISIGKQFLGE